MSGEGGIRTRRERKASLLVFVPAIAVKILLCPLLKIGPDLLIPWAQVVANAAYVSKGTGPLAYGAHIGSVMIVQMKLQQHLLV